MHGRLRSLFAFGMLAAVLPGTAHALPWDMDMYRQQSFQANEMARAPATGSVPVGHIPWSMTTEEAATNLKNPTPLSKVSIIRGKRIFETNCRTCHGSSGVGDGPVGKLGVLAVPNILDQTYHAKPDGQVYGVLMNGGANMPRYGYKFSDAERWDVINYVRFLQGRPVEGMERPQ